MSGTRSGFWLRRPLCQRRQLCAMPSRQWAQVASRKEQVVKDEYALKGPRSPRNRVPHRNEVNETPVSKQKRDPDSQRMLPLCDNGQISPSKTSETKHREPHPNILIGISRNSFTENTLSGHTLPHKPSRHQFSCGDRLDLWRVEQSPHDQDPIEIPHSPQLQTTFQPK